MEIYWKAVITVHKRWWYYIWDSRVALSISNTDLGRNRLLTLLEMLLYHQVKCE